ncbi:MAG: DUF3786 domain-containing protein [Phycisphaerales bacterium]|nr:MAG: DUF3786 domain-containing protein [Phycisphaerales bacterium]
MAHEGLWEKLEKLDHAATARRAGCQHLSDPERYVLTLLNTEYIVRTADKSIAAVLSASSERPAEFLEQLCVLAYLINAKDEPLSGKLVNGLALPGGQFFFRGVHCLPTEKLEQVFGDRPEALLEAARPLAAEQSEFGDASVRLRILPRVPVTIVVWGRCEQFEARASILFDKTAADQLPLDALLAAVNLGVEALTEAVSGSD